MNTSINSSTNGGSPHIAASSRSADDLVLASGRKRSATSASGTSPRSISHGSITSRRRSRSSAAASATRRHQPAPDDRASRRHRRARRRATSTSACSSKPSTHDRNAARLAHGTSNFDIAVGRRGDHTLARPARRLTSAARAASTRTIASGRVAVGTDRLRVVRAAPCAGRSPSGRSNASPPPIVIRPSMRSMRNVRARPRVIEPDRYQNPSRSRRPDGSTVRSTLAVAGSRPSPAGRPASRNIGRPATIGHRRRRPAPSGRARPTPSFHSASWPDARAGARRSHRHLQRPHLVGVEAQVGELVARAVDPVLGLAGVARRRPTISCSIGTPISRSAALSRSKAAAPRSHLPSGYWPDSSPAICTRLSGSGVSSSSASRLVRRSTRSAITRIGTVIGVLVEPAAGLAAEQTGFDHPRQQRRRGVQRFLELLVQALGDGERRVEADQVGQVQRAHRVAAALDHAGVDVFGRGEPRLHHPDRRQQVRDQQRVDHEPGAVLAADHPLVRARRWRTPSALRGRVGRWSSSWSPARPDAAPAPG